MRILSSLAARLFVDAQSLTPRQIAQQCLSDNCNEVAELKRNSYQHKVVGKLQTAFCSCSEYRVYGDSE